MEVQGLSWMGIRVGDVSEASAFLRRLGLDHQRTEGEMAVLTAKNGDTVELFGPGDEDHRHFDTGPVVGFEVDGVEFISGIERGGGMAWSHFRGPEGFVYELTAHE